MAAFSSVNKSSQMNLIFYIFSLFLFFYFYKNLTYIKKTLYLFNTSICVNHLNILTLQKINKRLKKRFSCRCTYWMCRHDKHDWCTHTHASLRARWQNWQRLLDSCLISRARCFVYGCWLQLKMKTVKVVWNCFGADFTQSVHLVQFLLPSKLIQS